jgi:hypothetical protein
MMKITPNPIIKEIAFGECHITISSSQKMENWRVGFG